MAPRGPALVAGAALGALALLLLIAAAQPLVTDDTWLHLALGRAYAAQGPWLADDPLLADAPGPPTPTAWLFDVALHGVERTTGFVGLRVLGAGLVAAIVVLAFAWLRERAESTTWASGATVVFLVLAAYRLVQLRPHLLTIALALVLYRLLLAPEARPRPRTLVAVVGLFVVWANVHAAFLLGPLLGAAAAGALLVVQPLRAHIDRPRDRARAVAIGIGATLGTVATLANPAGPKPHLAWFVAGDETPALTRVADEWSVVDPFSWPVPGLPPSPVAWLLFWALALGTAAATVAAVRSWRRTPVATGGVDAIDPALVGLAALSLVMPLIAVRFLWLSVFPLLLIVDALRWWTATRRQPPHRALWAAAAVTALLVPAFLRFGAWPMVTSGMPTGLGGYAVPYQAGKYHADQVWVLADTGVRGTAFTDYHMAGFTGFFLAPDVRTLVNGTLNVSPDVIAANLPLRLRRGERPGERFVDLLDRHGVDLFVGIRLPRLPGTGRPWFHTTAHLERTPGWITIFRNLTGAVYLRDLPRNRASLERVAAWYADQSVPFDLERGFDPEAVVRAQRAWAIQHGVVPLHFETAAQMAFGPDPTQRDSARAFLSSVYGALGLYERAIELDAPAVARRPGDVPTRRRLVWSLLRLHRIEEAAEAAGPLAERPPDDVLSRRLAETARRLVGVDDPEIIARDVAVLPVFTPAEAAALTAQVVRPAPRLPDR